MQFSLSQMFFFLTYFGLFFLILVFGENASGILLSGALTLLLLSFRDKLAKVELNTKGQLVILGFVFFLLVSFISIFFSFHQPQSVNRLWFYLFGFVNFLFFLKVDKKWMPIEVIWSGFILSGVMLAVLNLFFFFFPQMAHFLPPTNLLTANYGHNHSGVISIALLPIIYFFLSQKKTFILYLSIAFIFILNLALGFGRVALFLGLSELLFISFYLNNKKKVIWVNAFLGILILIPLFLILIYSMGTHECIFPKFQHQLCKPFKEEPRPAYWVQAFKGFKDKPILGWGGGTFSNISFQKYQDLYDYSAFTHNEYFQVLAEYGLLGFGAILLMVGLAYWGSIAQIIQGIKKKEKIGQVFLSMSILVLGIDAFFDYNWIYMGVWNLFLIFIALLLSESGFFKEGKNSRVLEKILKKDMLFKSTSIIILGWTSLYILSSALWAGQQKPLSQRIFPFVYWRVEDFLTHKENKKADEYFMLRNLYKNDTSVQEKLLAEADPKEEGELLLNLLSLKPKDYFLHFKLLKFYRTQENVEKYTEEWSKVIELYPREKSWTIPENVRDSEITDGLKWEETLLATNTKDATQIYRLIYKFDPVVLTEKPFGLLLRPQLYPENEVLNFLEEIHYPYKLLWPYDKNLSLWFLEKANRDISQKLFSNTRDDAFHSMAIDRSNKWEIWEQLSAHFTLLDKEMKKTNPSNEDLLQRMELLTTWKMISYDLEKDDYGEVNQKWKTSLGLSFMDLSKQFEANGMKEEMIKTFDMGLEAGKYLYKDEVFFDNEVFNHSRFTDYMEEYLKEGKTPTLGQDNRNQLRDLQHLAIVKMSQKQFRQANTLHKFMAEVKNQDELVQTQLALSYYFMNDQESALKVLHDCQQNFSPSTTNCDGALAEINHEYGDPKERYDSLAQQILKY